MGAGRCRKLPGTLLAQINREFVNLNPDTTMVYLKEVH
jgi:hypothetical protein